MDQNLDSFHPRISVVMPVYNGEKYLGEAIESILSQTFADFEFIIIDDGSTDNSLNIINFFAEKDERVRVVINKENLGLAKSLNIGIALAKGEYIARMDADDISLPERFHLQVNYLDENPLVDILGGFAEIIDESGHTNGKVMIYPVSTIGLRWFTYFEPPVAHPSAMIRRNILSFSGKYDEIQKVAQDYELWARLNINAQFSNIPEILLKYRIHKSNISHSQNSIQRMFACKISQRAISVYLGKDIPIESVRLLKFPYRTESRNNLTSTVRLLHEMYRKFLQDNVLDPTSLVYINLDIANRINQITKKNHRYISSIFLRIYSILLVIRAFIIDILRNNHNEVKRIFKINNQ